MFARVSFLILTLTIAAFAQGVDESHSLCPPQRDTEHRQQFERSVGSLTLSVVYTPEAVLRQRDHPCSFRVMSSQGGSLANGADEFVEEPISVDLDGDGSPELVVQTADGGSGGYGNLYIIRERTAQKLLKKLEGYSAGIADPAHNGHSVVVVGEDAFWAEDAKFIPFMCHACAPQPAVYFRLVDDKLQNVSAEFVAEYDRDIADARSRLDRTNIDALLGARNLQQIEAISRNDANRLRDTPYDILRIVVDYLYSGRDARAWEALREMWPSWDQQRLHHWLLRQIAESRRKGTLALSNY